MDKLLLALNQRSKKVDRVILERREIGVAVNCQEVINLNKYVNNDRELTSLFERYFAENMAAVTYCFALSQADSTMIAASKNFILTNRNINYEGVS